MPLRDYQQNGHDAAIDWIRRSIDPCLIEAATGAGKSHVIAALADTVHKASKGKHILCLAPSAELVEQNREKYIATGNPASIFSASAGSKCLRHPVVFGTPGTVKNRIGRFGSQFAMVIIDEADGITPTIKYIIDEIRKQNPKLRVVGLTATPYRLGEGYIYSLDENGKPTGNSDAYFRKKVFTVPAHLLIERGYLTPPILGGIQAERYDTLSMELNSRGQFAAADIDRAYHGHGRKTAAIIADIIEQSRNKQGVMIFAATIPHAKECMASLPPGLSEMITSETKKKERRDIIKRFKAKKFKYLVNVGVLTRGFDASHVDVVAILRATESVALLQQIIGRGLRLDNGKSFCLILDYAENIERHCPDGDVFNPKIKNAYKGGGESGTVNATCPSCGSDNEFTARKNDEGYEIDNEGYFVDLEGQRIPTDFGPMPAHYGRRCQGFIKTNHDGRYVQCTQRWTFKACPHCDAENDIAARYCTECRGEIIDPNEKLRIEFKQMKRDPTRLQTDNVVNIEKIPTLTRQGNECTRVDFQTEYRRFSMWYTTASQQRLAEWELFKAANEAGIVTVTYQKDPDSGFYRIHAFNREADLI